MDVRKRLASLRGTYSGQRMPADPLLDVLDQIAADLYGSGPDSMPKIGLREAVVRIGEAMNESETKAIGARLAVEIHSEALQDLGCRVAALETRLPERTKGES